MKSSIENKMIRQNMRGLKKCQMCGHLNGFRAKGCGNKECLLFVNKTVIKKSIVDPIQLISSKDTKIYSVRVKERETNLRNFVEITDTTLSTEDEHTSIVSRNAVCYVDTCKYDVRDIGITCKHVKGTAICLKRAQEITIIKEVLYSLRISQEQKDNLWVLYSSNRLLVPPLQRINVSTFTVQCAKSIIYPAGRLHIVVSPDNVVVPQLNTPYMCACKKYRMCLSSDNLITLESDICDHAVFVLAGLLSSPGLQTEFKKFVNLLKSVWQNDMMFEKDLLKNELLGGLTGTLMDTVEESMTAMQSNFSPDITQSGISKNIFDPNLLTNSDSSCSTTAAIASAGSYAIESQSDVNSTIQFVDLPSDECLEFSDCQIELMDEFKLTDQIDISNDEIIQLCDSDLFSENNIEPTLTFEDLPVSESQPNISSITPTYTSATSNNFNDNSSSIILPADTTTNFLPLPPGRCSNDDHFKKKMEIIKEISGIPTLLFDDWLDFVIESINMTVDYNVKDPKVIHRFNVNENFFDFFKNKFSIGSRKRFPNISVLIKTGKYKGQIKQTWLFATHLTVKRIFSTSNSSIEFERKFIEETEGVFVSSAGRTGDNLVIDNKYKPIHPTLYSAFIRLGNSTQYADKSNVMLEWIPSAFPKSKFGVLIIEFYLGFKRNNLIINR